MSRPLIIEDTEVRRAADEFVAKLGKLNIRFAVENLTYLTDDSDVVKHLKLALRHAPDQ